MQTTGSMERDVATTFARSHSARGVASGAWPFWNRVANDRSREESWSDGR